MWKALPAFYNHRYTNSYLFPKYPLELSQYEYVLDTRYNFSSYVYGGVIYSGSPSSKLGSNKGRVLINFIVNGILPSANGFDYLIFIDNDKSHVLAVIKSFEKAGIGHKLIAIYYPQNLSHEVQRTMPCKSSFNVNGCLID
jgi:hypothetical protein